MKRDGIINRKRLIGAFIDLIDINSPSFDEVRIGDYLAERLRHLGFRVLKQTYDRSFNIIASRKRSRKHAMPLMLSAHMDTIEPTEGIRYAITDKVIRSTGETVLGADDKSAIAQILEAVTALDEHGISHGDIELVFTSAEEKGLYGVGAERIARDAAAGLGQMSIVREKGVKLVRFAVVAFAAGLSIQSAWADAKRDEEMKKLAATSGCVACHSIEPGAKGPDGLPPVGPAWKDVAAKYKGDKGAAAQLTSTVMHGSNPYHSHWKGKVSGLAMPPNDVAIKEPDARKLVEWILSLAK